ncbi:MAG: type II toxin-antitoxin system VapC family toxin [Bryobacteraceae bacterium]|jgi:ribonuclease VapC
MVIDTSAIVAIALREPTRRRLLDVIESASNRIISSVSLLEAGMVLRARRGEPGLTELYQFVDQLVNEVVPFDDAQARRAIAAFACFGKGMGHRAQLNFGDCAVYALAVLRGEPVLATGGDFAATDIGVYRL